MVTIDTKYPLGTNALVEAPSRAPELEVARYAPYLDGMDMTDAQKTEMLQTLWSIMRSFVELGFSVKLCDPIIESFMQAANSSADGVQSVDATTTEGLSNAEGS